MIQHILKDLLSKHHFVLASSSPRRKAILESIGLKFTVFSSNFEEDLSSSDFENPLEFAKATAKVKALYVSELLENDKIKSDVIIAADTVVISGEEILGKPKDENDAIEMLTRLNGASHEVCTGVVILISTGTTAEEAEKFIFRSFHEVTEVKMATMSPQQISAYVKTCEPLDKAGGYGIQGIGGTFVEGIKGDYFNVVGFPLHRFCKEISDLHQNDLL